MEFETKKKNRVGVNGPKSCMAGRGAFKCNWAIRKERMMRMEYKEVIFRYYKECLCAGGIYTYDVVMPESLHTSSVCMGT